MRNQKLLLLIFTLLSVLVTAGCQPTSTPPPVAPTTPAPSPKPETPPIPELEGSQGIQFLAFGDFGTALPDQKLVAEAMAAKATRAPVQFALVLGDNFYPAGVQSVDDPQWQTKFESIYSQPSLNVDFYAVLGNHDHRLNPDAEVEYSKKPGTRWKMPDRYYAFSRKLDDQSEVRFFGLDTDPLCEEPEKPVTPAQINQQLTWLETELKKAAAQKSPRVAWKIVFGHHPIVSGGAHGSTRSEHMVKVDKLLKKYGVDVYLCGHDHDLQHIVFEKMNYVVSGGGALTRKVGLTPFTKFAASDLGFAWFRVTPTVLNLEFFAGRDRLHQIGYTHSILAK